VLVRVICRTCQGSGLVAPDPGQDQLFRDRDQTGSDDDQTWADHDQTSSDRDQLSADDDQEAADTDFAAGGDSALHERTKSARERTSRDRDDVGRMRDQTADARWETAGDRDEAAELRDHAAEGRDSLDHGQMQPDAHGSDGNVLLRAERDRAIAATDRARAADDRAKAAADRDEANREREEAFLAKAEARHELLLAGTDELTGAFTRKFGLENIVREIERARRTDDSLTLAFLDVDGLKEVNDSSGHSDGDRLLRRVVDTVRANVRTYDVIVRYGGDEFLCALPQLPREIAQDRMEKIAAVLRAEDAQHSIAYGLAEYDPADGIDELIGRADTELMEAKRRHKGST